MPPNVKGIQDFRVQSQGTKMPSSTSIKGGAKGSSTVNFQPFPVNQNVCFPKNSGRSVKGTYQLALLALPATGPHANQPTHAWPFWHLNISCNIRFLLHANPLIPTHFHHVWQHWRASCPLVDQWKSAHLPLNRLTSGNSLAWGDEQQCSSGVKKA